MSSAGPGEHGVEHRHGQLAGERVLLARVVGAEQRHAARELALGQMAERRAGAEPVVGRDGLPGELAQRHHDHGLLKERQLAGEIRRARLALGRGGLVGRRGAVHRRGDVGTGELEAVVAPCARRLRGEARPVEGGEEPVT